MSDTEEKNNRKSNGEGAGPTRSFDSSAPGPGSQVGLFRIKRELGRYFVNETLYSSHHRSRLCAPASLSLPKHFNQLSGARNFDSSGPDGRRLAFSHAIGTSIEWDPIPAITLFFLIKSRTFPRRSTRPPLTKLSPTPPCT